MKRTAKKLVLYVSGLLILAIGVNISKAAQLEGDGARHLKRCLAPLIWHR